jgi:hypothetical protein
MRNRDIVAIGTERAALARKLYNQAKTTRHRLLAENWAAKLRDFEGELDIVRSSTRRMDRLRRTGGI